MAAPGPSDARPHVGRRQELAQVVAAVTDQDGRGAIVAGPAGIGKSHLLERVVDELAAAGFVPLRAEGDPTRTVPFGAFGDLLPPLTGDPDHWALVLRAGLDHLVERAAGARPLLVADDLHALDPASAALVQQAVLDDRVRLVGTLRTGEAAPDAVTALWKHDVVVRVDLGPLTRTEAAELAELLAGGPVESTTQARLWTWTEGNPLLLHEIAVHARGQGGWHQLAGLWRLGPAPARSPRLANLLEERIAACPPPVADLVDAVALAGRLPLAVADALVGRSTLATAERLRLVRVRTDQSPPAVTLDHPMHGELRRAATTPDRRGDLRHRLLDVVEALSDPAGSSGPAGSPDADAAAVGAVDLALVAQWYLETGRVAERTPELLLAGAERAWTGNKPEDAAALARRSWELRHDDRTGQLLVSALARVGATGELEMVAPEVARTARSDGVRAQAVLSHALALFHFTNRPDLARTVLDEGASHVSDPGWRDTLAAEAASYALQMGEVAAAEAQATPLLDSPNRRTAAEAAAVVAATRTLQGRIVGALEAAERGLELALSLADDFVDVGQHVFHKMTALLDDGQVDEAEQLAHAALDEVAGRGDRFISGFLALSLGRTLRLRGRPRTAARWFQEATAAFQAVQRLGFAAWSLAGLAAVRAEVGDVEGARAAAARRHDLSAHPIRVGTTEVARSLAWVDVAAGDIDLAARRLGEVAARGLALRELVHAGHALHDLVRIGRASQAIDDLTRLAAVTDSTVLGLSARHAAASLTGDGAELTAVAEGFEALGCELVAAETWSEVSRLGGTDGRAVAAGRRATALAQRCEGAQTPLLAAGATMDALSEREREVATLAAAGLGRRAIAERLVVSPRTVDSHLQRVYRKLGVSGRDALARALAEPGDG